MKSVFISSTSKDLPEYRAVVDKAIRRLGMRPINMDDFGSQPGGAVGVSVREVGKADIFVGIIARRYGYVPEGMDKSVTEQEYDEAVRLNLPRLMYLLDPAYDWPEDRIEADETAQTKLAAFRARIEKQEVRSLFRTPEDLSAQVTADLTKLMDTGRRQQRTTRLMMGVGAILALALLSGLLLLGALPQGQREHLLHSVGIVPASATPTSTPTATFTPTNTATPTATFTPTNTPTSTPEFAQASQGEILVIVAEFENRNAPIMPGGETMAEQLNRLIDQAIASVREEHGLQVRVARTAEVVTSSERARAINEANNASILIWGSVDSAGISSNYTISTLWGQQVYDPVESTDFTAVSTLDEVAIRFRRSIDQAYVVNFTIGQMLFSGEQYEAALPLFEAAIDLMKSEPLDRQQEIGLAAAYFDVGYIYQSVTNEADLALAAYDQSLMIDPDWDFASSVYNNRGNARYDLGDLDGAMADYDKAIALKPDFAEAYYNRGNARYDLGDLDGAMADYDKAIALKPDLAEAYNNRGTVRDHLGDVDGAMADYDKAIALKPDYAEPYNNRGNARDYLGDVDGAMADYDKAIALKPDLAEAYNNRGTVRDHLGDVDGAMADYDKAIALKPDYAEPYNNRGFSHYNLGDLDRAMADFDAAIALKPDYVDAYFNRGLTHMDLGDLDRAIADFDAAIALKPDYVDAYFARGFIYNLQGNYPLAIDNISQYLAFIPDNVDAVDAIETRAEAYFALGDYEKALADFQAYQEAMPDDKFTFSGLAITHHALGNIQEAHRLWGQLLEIDSRYNDVEWLQAALNWADPLVEEARQIIAELELEATPEAAP